MSERLHCPWPGLLAALVLVASGCGGGHDLAIAEEFVPAGWVDLKAFAMEPEAGDG